MLIFFFRYQNELPKKIKSRGKEGHLTHEELVQLIKWKLAVSVGQLFYFYFFIFFYFYFIFPNLERKIPSPVKGLDPNEHPEGCDARDKKSFSRHR